MWDHLVALLACSRVDGAPIPLLAAKVRCILTGRMRVGDGEDAAAVRVIARGESWVTCPLETARKLRDAVGEEAFAAIENEMHGHWGWVYRYSDIANRHGHCNSNPNPELARSFRGFGI